jgi:serine/threonine-protein kinase
MTSASLPAALGVEGTVISRKYRLDSLLGEGGMGAVWRAVNLQLEVPVAIKLLRADRHTAELAERLRVEARAVAKLVHPSIVRVFDAGESESGEPFIVMELLDGESLGTLLERGPLLPTRAVQLLLPIAEALSLAHAGGIVHRDLKPDNIFVAEEGAGLQPKLLDFGIAQVMSALGPGARPTLGGVLVGSPDYMSPEQVRGYSDIDQRADVWGFCVVLYEAIAGQAPFEGDSCEAILASVLVDVPRPLSDVAGVDAELAALVHAGLAKERDERPASIRQLGQRLAAWLLAQGVQHDLAGSSLEAKWLGRVPSAPPSAPPLPRGRSWQHRALVAGAALVGCLAWVSAFQFQSSGTSADAAPVPTGQPVTASSPVHGRQEPATASLVEASPSEAAPASPSEAAPVALRSAPRLASGLPPAIVAARSARAELMNPY